MGNVVWEEIYAEEGLRERKTLYLETCNGVVARTVHRVGTVAFLCGKG